jgi:hypothetical protein
VCCSSDWDVPVELPLYRSLDDALRARQLSAAAASADNEPPLVSGPDLPEEAAAMVARTSAGDCVFYHRHSGLCVIQRDLGEPYLPATCRHFPRLAVSDRRGTFVSLSHYCPTAAGMLFRDGVPTAIVESPPAFPPADYDGLTVGADEWPPLLHPSMLMDAEGYSAWERHMVARCAAEPLSPEGVLATLERDARQLRGHVAGSGSLAQAIASLGAQPPVEARSPDTLDASLAMYAEAMTAVPDDLRPEPDEVRLGAVYERAVRPEWATWDAPLKRYLAAKAFASWTAYQGRGVLTIVRGLDAALALVRVESARQCRDTRRPLDAGLLKEAFRQADFILNHLAIGETLAEQWARVEDKSKIATTGP